MRIIDSHIHYWCEHHQMVHAIDELDMHLLNIVVVEDPARKWREQADNYIRMSKNDPKRISWCTSFGLPRFNEPDYIDKTIAELDRDFAAGAVAVKVWKNIGMEVKRPDGKWLMVDDPYLEPIFAHIEKRGVTLIAHIGEPCACWRPLDFPSPHAEYYREFPQWHMYGKPGVASWEELIASRDNLLARHPRLMVVGAHFGSMEHDVDEVAKRLRQYPNFYVDSASRIGDLLMQDQAKVKDFFMAFQDRILFGTDNGSLVDPKSLSEQEIKATIERVREHTLKYRDYYTTDYPVHFRGFEARGLKLPNAVAEKVCHRNATRCYGIK